MHHQTLVIASNMHSPDRASAGPSVLLKRVGIAVAVSAALGSTSVTAQHRYTMVREISIGSVDGEIALTEPRALALTRSGLLLSAHPREHLVRIIAPDGSLVRSIGRRGDGPGEFQSIGAIGLRGDTVWVTDSRHRRLSLFSIDGKLQREVTWNLPYRAPDEPLSIPGRYTAVVVSKNGVNDLDVSRGWPVMVYSAVGEVLDTVVVLDTHSEPLLIDGNQVGNPLADGAMAELSPAGDRLVVVNRRMPRNGSTGTFTLTWIAMESGDTVGRSSWSYDAVQLSPEVIAQITSQYSRARAPASYVRQLAAALRNQRHIPPISALVHAVDESAVWVARERLGRTSVRWYRFTPSGMTGFVEIPANSRIAAARGRQIWVLEQDDLDVPYIRRYRIDGGGSP